MKDKRYYNYQCFARCFKSNLKYDLTKNEKKVNLNLPNYGTKSDLKNATSDTSDFAKKADLASLIAKKADLASLKTAVDKLNKSDVKLKTVPVDLKKIK